MTDTLSRNLGRLALAVGAALLVVNLSVVSYGVLTRYVLGSAPIWTDELSRFLIIATVLIAAGAVWSEGLHMRVGILERLAPAPLARLLRLYQWLLTLAIAGAGAWISWEYAWSVGAFRTQGLGISRTVPMLSLPLGFALLFLHALLHGPRPLPSATDPDEPPTEAGA